MTSYTRVLALNRYYKITRFYAFLWDLVVKMGISLLSIGAIVLLLELFILDFSAILTVLTTTFSSVTIFSTFLLSETLLGLLPPEVFIAWASAKSSPWLFLFGLATLSYLGGIFAYLIGTQLTRIPAINTYLEIKAAKHMTNLRKWGGFFIIVGATLPPPHAIISMASGTIRYPFSQYLLWSLFRYLRFLIYGLVIFNIL